MCIPDLSIFEAIVSLWHFRAYHDFGMSLDDFAGYCNSAYVFLCVINFIDHIAESKIRTITWWIIMIEIFYLSGHVLLPWCLFLIESFWKQELQLGSEHCQWTKSKSRGKGILWILLWEFNWLPESSCKVPSDASVLNDCCN